MTTSASQKSTPRIKLRGNGHATKQQQKTKSPSASSAKSQRPILRAATGSQLVKGTAPLPGAGAPVGNQNPYNGRLVKNAFINELAKTAKYGKSRSGTLAGLEAIARKVINLAMKSSLPAAREVFDRVDGRPAQTIIGDPENPVFFKNVSDMSDEELEQVARGTVINGTAERVD